MSLYVSYLSVSYKDTLLLDLGPTLAQNDLITRPEILGGYILGSHNSIYFKYLTERESEESLYCGEI